MMMHFQAAFKCIKKQRNLWLIIGPYTIIIIKTSSSSAGVVVLKWWNNYETKRNQAKLVEMLHQNNIKFYFHYYLPLCFLLSQSNMDWMWRILVGYSKML